MSARSAAASSSKGAAAAASANAARADSAAAASARPSLSHAASTQRIGAAASAGKRNARAAKQSAAPPSSSLCGRKRSAAGAAADSSSSADAAAASDAHSSNRDQTAPSGSQHKKQRGEPSNKSISSSAAVAASSVGFDPLPAQPRRPASEAAAAASSAAVQPSSKHDESSDDEKSDDSDEDDDEEDGQESMPAAASAASQPRPRKPRDPKPHRLFTEAKGLLLGALPFAEAEFAHCSDVARTEALARARAAVQRRASAQTMAALGQLSDVLLWGTLYPNLPSEQAVLRDWLLQVDQLWTQLAAALCRMKLSLGDCHALVIEAVFTGALQVFPSLVRRLGHMPSLTTIAGFPLLTLYCNAPCEHLVSLQPYFRLFEFGLDPTEVAKKGNPLSAVQLARNFICGRVLPSAPSVSDPFASMRTAVEKAESRSLPSVLHAQAIQQREATWTAETQRRAVLHTQFMHALIPAWLAHSTKVLALLLDAAPDRLIPPLVDIVSRYLDLEGVPPERSVPADESAEMADSGSRSASWAASPCPPLDELSLPRAPRSDSPSDRDSLHAPSPPPPVHSSS